MSNKHIQNTVSAVSLGTVIMVPLLLMFQGLDITDTGWLASNYLNFVEHPEGVRYWFHLWLTYGVGALWSRLIPNSGLLWLRFGGVLIYWLTATVVFFIYRGKVARHILLLALAIGIIGNFAGRISIIHYNNLSLLFLSFSLLYLLRGLEKKRTIPFFLGGFFGGLNIFVRIPNVLFLAIGLTILYDSWINKDRIRDIVRRCMVFAAGVVVAVGIVFILMLFFGHLQRYLSSVADLFSFGKEEMTNYGAIDFERRFITQNVTALLMGAILITVWALSIRVSDSLVTQRNGTLWACVCLIALFFLMYHFGFLDNLRYLLIGIAYLTAMGILLLPEDDERKLRNYGFSLLVGLLVLSTGSDTGISVSEYGLVLILPLIINFWSRNKDVYWRIEFIRSSSSIQRTLSFSSKQRKKIGILLVAMSLLVGYSQLFHRVYRDSSDRGEMTAQIDHPRLKYIYTTPEREQVVSGVIKALDEHVKPGDPLLTFESVCMLHYLAGTIPFSGNAWPIQFTPGDFQRELQADLKRYGKAPIAVIAKHETSNGSWPIESPLRDSKMAMADREVFNAFLEEHQYESVWENETFVILKPRSSTN